MSYYEFRSADGRICCAGEYLCPACRQKVKTHGPTVLSTAAIHSNTTTDGVPPPPDLREAILASRRT